MVFIYVDIYRSSLYNIKTKYKKKKGFNYFGVYVCCLGQNNLLFTEKTKREKKNFMFFFLLSVTYSNLFWKQALRSGNSTFIKVLII